MCALGWRWRGVRGRGASHARALGLALALSSGGCGPEGVDAVAIWVDAASGDQLRRIHVYDRGERYELEVAGKTAPQEFVRLGPRGRGVLVRLGPDEGAAPVGAWLSLVDGRRLPTVLPRLGLSQYSLAFSAGGDALLWLEDGALELVPLAPGLALERDEDGVVQSLALDEVFGWAVSAAQAPVILVRRVDGSASFVRYPTTPSDPMALVELARVEGVATLGSVFAGEACNNLSSCGTLLGLAPRGERAIARVDFDEFVVLDSRPRGVSGPLELPPELAEQLGSVSLQAVLGPAHSVWTSPGRLHLWDEGRELVESLPVFSAPPHRFARVGGGEALTLVSAKGPMIRVDREGIEALSFETTECQLSGGFDRVVSPSGRWAAWSCADVIAGVPGAADEVVNRVSGVVVRVSAAGLERFAGVPMRVLAIDDEGAVLLNSAESAYVDEVDGIGSSTRPLSLFALSRAGVLTRVDELEPAPAPVLVDADSLTFIQAVSDPLGGR